MLYVTITFATAGFGAAPIVQVASGGNHTVALAKDG